MYQTGRSMARICPQLLNSHPASHLAENAAASCFRFCQCSDVSTISRRLHRRRSQVHITLDAGWPISIDISDCLGIPESQRVEVRDEILRGFYGLALASWCETHWPSDLKHV